MHSVFSKAAVLAIAIQLVTVSALADIPPPDACETAGKTCNNAGADANKPGKCVSTKCTRTTPDGTTEYDCLRCQATGDAPAEKDEDDGCSVGGRIGSEAGLAGLAAAIGFVALYFGRRRH